MVKRRSEILMIFSVSNIQRITFTIVSLALATSLQAQHPRGGVLIDTLKIWDQAPHNAFTDLIHFNGSFYCVFREARYHTWDDSSVLRLLKSVDGEHWSSVATFRSLIAEYPDIRDPKLAETPDGRLMLIAAVARIDGGVYQTLVSFSPDGNEWGESTSIGEVNMWIWDITWHEGVAYGVGYYTKSDTSCFTRLYASQDGMNFSVLVDTLFSASRPSETSIVFLEDHTAVCLIRRDFDEADPVANAQLGLADPPYTEWSFVDAGTRLGSPSLLRLTDDHIFMGARLYNNWARTALLRLDIEQHKLTEFLSLARSTDSKGDAAYPGLVFHDDYLWVSYYSSDPVETAVYLAKVQLKLPSLTVNPASIDFDTVAVGDTGRAVLTLTNTGSADLNLKDISPDHSYFKINAYTPVVPPEGQQDVEVLYLASHRWRPFRFHHDKK